MKLISAHINDFGKLHDVDIDFKEDLNVWVHDNGWGKTTFSVFIKSMLYGMEHSTARNLKENEKARYRPWQGGRYGGSLVFEENGRQYKVTREFGSKKSDDKFSLLDLKTNKTSSDYTENLGNELFGINKDTYSRSVFVELDSMPESSPDISAKLNNLVEAGDVEAFDKAKKALEEKASSLKKARGNPGLIQIYQNKIDENRELLVDIQNRLVQNKTYSKRIAEIEESLADAKEKQKKYTEQLSLNAKFESKMHYEQLKKDLKNAQNLHESLLAFFDGKVPDAEVIKTIDDISSEYTTVETNIKNGAVTQSEKEQYEAFKNYFAGDIPTKAQIEKCLAADSEYKQYVQGMNEKKLSAAEQEEYEFLSKRFKDKPVSEQIINAFISDVTQINEQKGEISKAESELNSLRTEKMIASNVKKSNPVKILLYILAGIFALAGAGLFVAKFNVLFGIAAFVLAAVFLVVAFVLKSPKADTSLLDTKIADCEKNISLLSAENEKKENALNSFIAEYCSENLPAVSALSRINVDFNRYAILLKKAQEYEQWKSLQNKNPEDFENELKAFVKRYCKTDDISAVAMEIQNLNDKLTKLDSLERRINDDAQNKNLLDQNKEKLEKILAQYKTEKAYSFAQQVQQIHDKITEIKNAESGVAQCNQKIREFEENTENNLEELEALSKPEISTDEIKSELEQVTREINEGNSEIARNQKNIDDNSLVTEKKEDIESENERLAMDKQQKNHEYEILQKTKELLSKAKENLDANYSDPMKEGFEKYINMTGSELKLMIDTDLKVSVESEGQIHDSIYLSEGYKDLVNFCSRMALVDALFKESKPPVILDDPFVNLDGNKIPNALRLVKEMSKENQILYFTCHKSRIPE